jgi:predicted dehydrogenase
MKLLKCGIIGYGYMGDIRRRIIEGHPDLSLGWICDPEIDKLPSQPGTQITTEADQVIESPVDAIFICTPNNLIPQLAVAAMDRQKHVFCEKPPGRSVQDIVWMREAEQRNPTTKLMFGFNHRYHPGIMRAKTIIETGRFGEILTLRGLYGKSGGRDFPTSWRNDQKISGGGILLDQGIHMLDLFHFFLGEFTSVKSLFSNKHWGFDVEDNAVLIMSNVEGQLAMLHSSATFWKHMFEISIILEKGYLKVEGLLSKTGSYGRETLTVGRRQFEDETEAIGNPPEEITYFDTDDSWNIEVDMFLKAIRTGEAVTASSSEDALSVMKLIQQCYRESGLRAYNCGGE